MKPDAPGPRDAPSQDPAELVRVTRVHASANESVSPAVAKMSVDLGGRADAQRQREPHQHRSLQDERAVRTPRERATRSSLPVESKRMGSVVARSALSQESGRQLLAESEHARPA